MKGLLDRTKVVVRHLPPSMSQSAFAEQIDGRFTGRYDWVVFRPGKDRLGFLFFGPVFYVRAFVTLVLSLIYICLIRVVIAGLRV